jgi:hypothetical protein
LCGYRRQQHDSTQSFFFPRGSNGLLLANDTPVS